VNEYDETQLFPDMRLARILLERLGKNSLSVSVEVAAEKILEAQRALADKDAEIAELREEAEISAATIEMQAVILTDSVNAIRGEPPELTLWSHHDLADLIKNVLVINPIGDTDD